MTVVSLAGNAANARALKNNKSGDLPWSAQQLAKILAQSWWQEARITGEKFEDEDYESSWREVYSGYKWLCKIKHPTFKSAIHDASATFLTQGEYVVMAAPDMRPENVGVKVTVLAIAINRVYGAVRSFALALECDKTTQEYESFNRHMREVSIDVQQAYGILAAGPLPFDIRGSPLAQDWTRLKEQKKGR